MPFTPIFNDTFQSYNAGNGVPAGFQLEGIVFNDLFINTGSQPSPTPAPGFYEKTGIIYLLFGSIRFPTNVNLNNYITQNTSVWWSTYGDGNVSLSPGTFTLASVNPVSPYSRLDLLSVIFALDGSITVSISGASPTANTQEQDWYIKTWQLFQLDVTIFSLPKSGVNYFAFTFSLAVDGKVLMANNSQTSNIPISTSWNNSATCNAWIFTGPANGQYFSEIAATTDLQTVPFFPNPGGVIHAFNSQMVTELIKIPLNNARTSQMIVERMKQSNVTNARVSQMIVELIRKGGFALTGGFNVRES